MKPRPFIVTPHGVIEMRDWSYHRGGCRFFERRWTCACGDSSEWVPLRNPQWELLEDGLALHAATCHSQDLSQAGAPGRPPTTATTTVLPPEPGASEARSGTAIPVYKFSNPVAAAGVFGIPFHGEIDIDKDSAGSVPGVRPPDTEATLHGWLPGPAEHSHDTNNGQKGRYA